MQAAELETDLDLEINAARAGRALALIAFSVVAILVTAAIYVHPTIGVGTTSTRPATPPLEGDYKVASVDFTSQRLGWLVVDFPSGDFAVIRTTDGGATWSRQLTAPADSHAVYAKFFDDTSGIVALVGGQPVVRRSLDGGVTWSTLPALTPAATVLSWSFMDSLYGWLLARESATATPKLFRTEDGGLSWVDLGSPVIAPDQAFQAQFSHFTTGWLSTVSTGPYAYRTQDFGATWIRVPLPATAVSSATGGTYFVAVRPTTGLGAVATVVYFPPLKGRSAVGGNIRSYPPLTVHAFDGGRPHTYLYTTVLDEITPGPFASEPPPNQVELRTLDAGKTWSTMTIPADTGAIAYSDASNLWWVGGGKLSGSSDGGVSWSDPRSIDAVSPLPGTLQVLDGEHAWFAAQIGPHPRLEGTIDGGRHWALVSLPLLEDRPEAT